VKRQVNRPKGGEYQAIEETEDVVQSENSVGEPRSREVRQPELVLFRIEAQMF
jgi:hypothetical protein